ncbi:MAG: SDR family oxidoreductase [Bacteriovorax sp.]|nr:SDR family oxidoreductase [Bacteriovorax sp.]
MKKSNAIGKKGITINSIDPGPVDTGWMSSELKNNLENISPFGRVGLPSDVASLAVFLASAESQWITGQVLKSRGGL